MCIAIRFKSNFSKFRVYFCNVTFTRTNQGQSRQGPAALDRILLGFATANGQSRQGPAALDRILHDFLPLTAKADRVQPALHQIPS